MSGEGSPVLMLVGALARSSDDGPGLLLSSYVLSSSIYLGRISWSFGRYDFIFIKLIQLTIGDGVFKAAGPFNREVRCALKINSQYS